MTQLKINEIAAIVYRKADDSITERSILPTAIPASVVTALDVTELDAGDRIRMQQAFADYTTYRELVMKRMFNFTDWLQHTGRDSDLDSIKFRSFTVDKIV